MRYAYYPGCSLHATAKEYDASTRALCRQLGIELVEIPDWNCCGASSAHNAGHFLSTAIPGRNLILAEQSGLDVTAPCAACYQRLRAAEAELKSNEMMRSALQEAMEGLAYKGSVKVKTILEVIDLGFKPEYIVKPLKGLKVVCYYGCLMVKPPKITGFDDSEDPQSMDNLMFQAGAEVLQWPYKTECCGGSLPFYKDEQVYQKLIRDILQIAQDSGARAVVTACPLCMSNLDMRQSSVDKNYGTKYNIPVFYFTELIGLAMGLSPSKLGLNRHFVDPLPLLNSLKLV